ncbi:DRTGG domain protein [Clostridium tepidiprofundi DSM 19306]|uniref:DRTGG domain protein n=1 Tax=Clostridium tepidiprofundi DSM 19306 TaxID=1121338 RepID=A0A151B3K2_9CLOT|nr:DRTGG domain-containing protein [Clostridium tepidiprofundi]KYH34332.1 DRTGG domain protein [Clostridium tepidiprofundi DSM 19306]
MKLIDIKELLDAEFLTKNNYYDKEIERAFGCDLMSDVLARVSGDVLLLTGLANIQTIRTAEMKDIKCIVYVRGKRPSKEVIDLAEEKEIILMSTKHIMFTACGILFNAGIKGAEIQI